MREHRIDALVGRSGTKCCVPTNFGCEGAHMHGYDNVSIFELQQLTSGDYAPDLVRLDNSC